MYEFGVEERAAADRVLSSGHLFRYMEEARESDLFETEFAKRLGARHALGTSSGTAALICGLAALDVGPGDEVIIPAYGYVADVLAVLAVGAVPIVCEIDESLSLDPADIEEKLTARTKAVMPVHMCGLPSDMDAIMAVARRRDLKVMEDACQSIGGEYKGRPLGTIGDAGAFSFNQAKILTAGEGGLLVTSDPGLHERAFIMHDASSLYDGRHFDQPVFAGLAFRMNEVSAAILRVQLTRLDAILSRLRVLRAKVQEVLGPVDGIRLVPSHDSAGACGTTTAVLLPDEESARRFRTVASEIPGFWAYQGIALGHSFFEWELLHERRGAHHPLRNPLTEDAAVQIAGALPRSRDLLSRVVFLGYPLDLTDGAVERLSRMAGQG